MSFNTWSLYFRSILVRIGYKSLSITFCNKIWNSPYWYQKWKRIGKGWFGRSKMTTQPWFRYNGFLATDILTMIHSLRAMISVLYYVHLILFFLNFWAKIFNDEKMILHGHHNFPTKRMTFQYLSLVHASKDETYNFKIYVLKYSCILLIFTFHIKKRQIDHIRNITKRHWFWRVTFSSDFTSSKFLSFITLSYKIAKYSNRK